MEMVTGHDDAVVRWAADRLDGIRMINPHIAVGVIDDDGALRAALILEQHTETTAEFMVYSEDNALTVPIARRFFRMVFGGGVWRLQARTAKSNKVMKRTIPKFGFKFEGVARDWWGPGHDALVYYMTPDDCRWLRRA